MHQVYPGQRYDFKTVDSSHSIVLQSHTVLNSLCSAGQKNQMHTLKIGKTIFKNSDIFYLIYFSPNFRCACGFSGQRCEFKTVDSSHSIVLRSHTSSKCVLGLTHYPCWKCPESGRENVRNPDCPDFKNFLGFRTRRDVRLSPMLRSHASSKCVLGLTHYPCWNF